MSKAILITGATDGIGLETARKLVEQGQRVLLHGRSPEKLQKVSTELSRNGMVESHAADLSDLTAVKALAKCIRAKCSSLDVLINNAGVLQTTSATTKDGHDVRFVVNAVAPYILTKELLPLLGKHGRVVNVSSAAQATVDINALRGKAGELEAMSAYAQSKLAITMWSRAMADALGADGPVIVAVNPGSLLGSKMVKEHFGIAGKDLGIGADILVRASLSDEFSDASGRYFDNDSGRFSRPHADAQDMQKCRVIVDAMEKLGTH